MPGFLASVQSKLMTLLWSINFQSTIASQFSADRGIVNLVKTCNFRLYMYCVQKCVPKGIQ
jgi:hypothetical protein